MAGMNDVIDMAAMSNPFLVGGNDEHGVPQMGASIAVNAMPKPALMVPLMPSPGLARGMSNPAFSAIQAIAASRQLHLSSQNLQQFHHHHQQHPQMMAHNHHHFGGHDDDDSMSTASSCDMDDHSYSSWSESDDDEDDNAYEMYAPVAGASRGQLLRPMSVDQITALAVATGARKPQQLQQQQNSMSAQTSHNPRLGMVATGGRSGSISAPQSSENLAVAKSAILGPRSVSMPKMNPEIAHYHQQHGAQCPCTDVTKPDDVLKELLQAQGKTVGYSSYDEIPNFFLPIQPQHIEAFQQDIVTAVRGKDVPALMALQKQGRMLQCCNKFGESIVHMACRQSSVEVVEFLMSQVDIRVCCDSGRTPLHDACWTQSPDFDIVSLLLAECPDLLRVKDKRGFSPLAYVPHGQWRRWGNFLEQNKDLLVFKGFN
ncbi:ANK [Seminavis robusta]|uniref:ANK n=1 Tax=Seminavis robusta TaxID=568900 RepID=A0A9N8D841_9STRA|nr:ANK [Seminavis robusta]|eukprot:Sro31_g020370.1 ANK (429) ;mRNA; r:113005-114291